MSILIFTEKTATSPSLRSLPVMPSGMSTAAPISGPSQLPSSVCISHHRLKSITSSNRPTEARQSIYILDWWLSPELYLRRPPSRNEQYRLDNMLKAAAERGVQVNIIVYKEVPQALTCEFPAETCSESC